ncbi:hypothetical protein GLOTRDRAFT_116124 [Gloeophyllum trabeum ATCC 11539]|uniref:Glycosyltransferase 61 catalytic domain-containing protein n=1 Tax=Gloeophyllum trabeum (strain ATCC 11539 / FP-39264 / Madison 617) TaxID=670483 RepID=S7Q4R1_GLOTA|nr:uncharacterized protein GLOTRDRAFT_116124 [Gloeophyllum trabeum ATCC 11539]EPQ54991.1 hypothetical protein GLOTRDRAFT_116124 [Gloeophyllum trabeum ATCC 11539]
MSPPTPTTRELALVVVLLFSLVFFVSRSHSGTQSAGNQLSSATQDLAIAPYDPSHVQTPYEYGSNRVDGFPETTVVAHVPGWTIFDRLYLYNGTAYIVTDDPKGLPDRSKIISKGRPIRNGPVEVASRLPTDQEMRIVSTAEAREIFGWWVNDPAQFITHYYHWSAELFFGLWRTYSSLDPTIPANGSTHLPPPRRLLFSHLDAAHWRDYAAMNEWVLRAAFPGIALEFNTDWAERAGMGAVSVLDRVVLADRSAAMYAYNFLRTQRTASVPFALPGSAHWWSTIRGSVMQFAGFSDAMQPSDKYVITYISRQEWGRRMLKQEDHERLVQELYKLRDTYGYEVVVANMDKMSRVEQLQLAGRTTIMMGVHGNGLTSLVWMKPQRRSTVMEFFFPGGFAHDYEWTTRALGMVHYGFWGDRAFTRPDVPQVAYPEGFQGNSIPIDGALVARLCHERLTLAEETDD